MSNMLKCPNPSCPYVFDPSQVPAGVVLSCPRCAMQFTLGPPVPTAPAGAAAPPAPPAAPVRPADPDLEAIGSLATQERGAGGRRADRAPADRRSRGARPPAGGKLQTFVMAGIVAVLLAGAALAIIFKLTRRGETVPADTVSRLTDINVGVDAPPAGWTRDDATRVKLGSPFVLAYKRENPEAYMGFGATEPGKGRPPRNSEMRTDLMGAFPKLFSAVREEAAPETQWLGEPIAPNLGFKFRATSTDDVAWAGEAYAVSHKGIAYYWLCWCPENEYENVKGEFAAFRGKFKLLEARKDWKETRSAVIDYKGDRVPYTISDAEEVWFEPANQPLADYQKEEPDLDKRLRVNQTPRRDRKAIPDEAELRVNILDATGDPREVARQFAQDRETARIRELNAEFTPPTFEELKDDPQGDPVVTDVPSSTPVVRLRSKVKEASNASRLIVASGLRVGDKIVVVRCWCEYGKRTVFETRFVQIASSLR